MKKSNAAAAKRPPRPRQVWCLVTRRTGVIVEACRTKRQAVEIRHGGPDDFEDVVGPYVLAERVR